MIQKALAILLAVSWIVLSGVDILEDLELESRDSPSASNFPSAAKPVKLTSGHVELASHTLERPFRFSDLESNNRTKLAASSLDSGALRSHKG